jgi:hypothetical protein
MVADSHSPRDGGRRDRSLPRTRGLDAPRRAGSSHRPRRSTDRTRYGGCLALGRRHRESWYAGRKPKFPLLLGADGAGRVAAVGPRVRRLKVLRMKTMASNVGHPFVFDECDAGAGTSLQPKRKGLAVTELPPPLGHACLVSIGATGIAICFRHVGDDLNHLAGVVDQKHSVR